MPWLAAALLALVAVLNVTVASAGQRRVAVLRPDDELLRAISLALAPWGLEIVRSDAPMPGSSQPEAVRTARRLAQQLNVEAVIWVTSVEGGSLLWVFDVPGKDVTTRLLEETSPFDSAAAAAVALSVKTVLRESPVAPPENGLGSRPADPSAKRVSALELGAGGQWLADDAIDLRLELGGVLWLLSAQNLGVSVALSWGPGVRIDGPTYSGRYRELAAGAKVRVRLVRTQNVSLAVSGGASAHFATLEGTLSLEARESKVERVNASIDLLTSIDVNLSGAIYVGASLGGAYSPAYRRYLVGGRPIFSPWPVTATLATHVGVELF
jgi:hypothetical protein